MKLPNTIPKSTQFVYCGSDLKIRHGDRKILSYLFESELSRGHNLKEICLHTISKCFDILSPIPRLLEQDFKYLVNILSTDLHLEYTIHISDEAFWERCYEEIFPEKYIYQNNYDGFWKKTYLNTYLQLLIENAEYKDLNKVIEISALANPYIECLTLTTLKIIEDDEIFKRVRFTDDENKCSSCKQFETKFREETCMDHITLDRVLHNLINLKELRLEFSLNNLAEYRNEMLFKLSILDCELICRGLSSIENFKILKLNCYIDDVRAKIFAKFIASNKNIEEINFAYCGMSDEPVKELSIILYNEKLRIINLSNNEFGDEGIKALSYAIANKSEGCIDILNLEMNLISDVAASYIASALVRTKDNLNRLILRSCGINNQGAIKISGALKYNRSLHALDIAGNDFSSAEKVLLESLRLNPILKCIEARYSGLSDNSINEMLAILKINRERKIIDELRIEPLYMNEPEYLIWDYDPDNPNHESGFYLDRIPES